MFRQPPSSTCSVLCSMEKTRSPISPYTCYELHALRYGWSAMVPWSRLFLLHVHGLCARCYGLWASQGLDFRNELTAWALLILCIITLSCLYNDSTSQIKHVMQVMIYKHSVKLRHHLLFCQTGLYHQLASLLHLPPHPPAAGSPPRLAPQ